MTRKSPSRRSRGLFAAHQKIALDVALRGVTIEAAYSLRKENELGSIAIGKIANMTVLEKDPYEVKPEKLRDIGVWGTVFEGRKFAVDAADKPKPRVRAVPKEKIDRLVDNLAIKRLGRFEDVANVIDFFVRPESDYITGQVIYLGGM